MKNSHSVTELIGRIKDNDSAAYQLIWDRFIDRLIRLSSQKLKHMPRRAVDEEDVALEAFNAFFRGVKENRFARLEGRDDLWQVLAMLTERKAFAALRHELAKKRGEGKNRGESVFELINGDSSAVNGLQEVQDPENDVIDGFASEITERLNELDQEILRKIALRRLEGFSNNEIATELRISLRAVERKLQLIRQKWDVVPY